ncbi:MAG: hypothetical protein ABI832_20130 [bacterium]
MARQILPWRYCTKPGDTALNAQQLDQLSVQFALPAEDLAELSERLTWALGPHYRPRSIFRALEAGPKGETVFDEAMRELSKAHNHLEKAHLKLRSLSISTPVGEDRYQSRYQRLFGLLLRAIANIETVEEGFKEAKAAGMAAALRDLPVKGGVKDERRSMVCGEIIRFWDEMGRNVSYSTAPGTSERKGELIRFINAIVAFVTEPSAQLTGETIKDEITDMKRFLSIERRLTEQ